MSILWVLTKLICPLLWVHYSGIKKDRKLNKNKTSGIRGVHFDKDRGVWVAQIMFQRKAHNLGRYKTKSKAVKARLAGEEHYFGKYS